MPPKAAGRCGGETGELNEPTDDDVEQWAWQLLRRWGVVFRDLLNRESNTPRWYRLLQAYRRLEARGEIRGGRFILGVAGEQFATADTVRRLRQLRDLPADAVEEDQVVVLSAADPLNLVGIITSDAKVPRKTGNRIAFVNGVPSAALQAGEVVPIGKAEPPHHALAALGGVVCLDQAGSPVAG